MNKTLIILALFLIHCGILSAQNVTVRGTVSEADTGIPIPGANVLVKGTNQGLTTNFDGNYLIEVPVGATLEFSYIGFISKELKVTKDAEANIYLEIETALLDEVVLVAYGTQKKESVVGAQSTVKAEQLKVPVGDLTTAIAGRLSGVVATQRGGGPGQNGANLFIRGVSTFASSPQSPLLVVDGVPDRSINNIDPEDIESFTVLKAATATAVYGTRGANGVIILTTK